MISKEQFKKCKIGDRVVWGTLPSTKKEWGSIIEKGYNGTLKIRWDFPDPDTDVQVSIHHIDKSVSLNLA